MAGQTVDGPWLTLGPGTGTTDFYLETAALASARFIRIMDDGDGVQNTPGAGFDLDAIQALSQPTGINTTEEHPGTVTVYPNPATETITVEVQSQAKNGSITICNSQGIIILTKSITDGVSHLDIRGLAKGIYFVKFTAGNTAGVIKLIKHPIY